MGKDIHVVLERKTEYGWEYFDPGFDYFDARNYHFFHFLDEVCEPGCPEELMHRRLRLGTSTYTDNSGQTHVIETCEWDTIKDHYLFGFEFITLADLIKAAGRRDRVWISEEFYEKFLELGGVFPDQMRVSYNREEDVSNIIGVQIMEDFSIQLQEYIEDGIRDLQSIAQHYQLQEDELRICFAFDW